MSWLRVSAGIPFRVSQFVDNSITEIDKFGVAPNKMRTQLKDKFLSILTDNYLSELTNVAQDLGKEVLYSAQSSETMKENTERLLGLVMSLKNVLHAYVRISIEEVTDEET